MKEGKEEVLYGVRSKDGSGTLGFKTAEEAMRRASENATIWVLEHGGVCELEIQKVTRKITVLGTVCVKFDTTFKSKTLRNSTGAAEGASVA